MRCKPKIKQTACWCRGLLFFLSPVQTDATLLANNSQHCWMLHGASVCTPRCMLLSVVAQSLKPVKLFSQQLPTFLLFRDRQSLAQQCWIRLHGSSFTGSTKNDTWSISGNVSDSEAKMPGTCCWDERSDGSYFWQWQRCNFLPLWEIKNYFGQSFDVCVFFREYSVLKLAKNRIGVVWFTVIDVEIAGLHVEDMPKRWLIFALFVYCMFRATRYKKKL